MARRHMIDEMDFKIMKRLQLDARISNVRLAEDVHLSPSACLEPVKALEKDGLIRRYVADFDLSKICSTVMLLVEVILENHREADFERFSGGDPQTRRSFGMLQNRRPDRLSDAGPLPRYRPLQRAQRLYEPWRTGRSRNSTAMSCLPSTRLFKAIPLSFSLSRGRGIDAAGNQDFAALSDFAVGTPPEDSSRGRTRGSSQGAGECERS